MQRIYRVEWWGVSRRAGARTLWLRGGNRFGRSSLPALRPTGVERIRIHV